MYELGVVYRTITRADAEVAAIEAGAQDFEPGEEGDEVAVLVVEIVDYH